MKNKIVIIVLSWLMVLSTMLIIYNLTGETAAESTETSGGIINTILNIFLSEDDVTEELVAKFQNPIRKLAHFTIFALLGFCFANAFKNSFEFKSFYKYLLSIISTFIYASFDEFRQNFVENRGPSFKDVLIDSLGGLAGVLLYVFMIYIINKVISKRKLNKK